MAGWHHRLDGREFEWSAGVGDGQGGLACSDSWGCKGSDTTERLNWTELKSRICPNCTCTPLFLVPYSFFVFCSLRSGVSRCKFCSTAAKGPRSQVYLRFATEQSLPQLNREVAWALESLGRFGAMCAEVKVKASEINENSGWEEALGMDTDLRKKKKKKLEKNSWWISYRRKKSQESMEIWLYFKTEFQ